MNVLGLSGSLRRGSYNSAALRAAQELAPAGMTIDIHPLDGIPLYNEDLRAEGFPPSVALLRERIRQADAVLFSTPEYNYSLPAVLKNAIDWASRRPDQPWEGKLAAIMGVSTGRYGTSRAQAHLRLVCTSLDIRPLNRPEVMIAGAREKFSEDGALVDLQTRDFIAEMLRALSRFMPTAERQPA